MHTRTQFAKGLHFSLCVLLPHFLSSVFLIQQPLGASDSGLDDKAVGGEEEGWMSSSDDEFTVSKRLEELQKEAQMKRMTAPTPRITVEGVSMTCSSPKRILYVYPPSTVDKNSEEEDCCKVQAERFIHCDDLEIDPSAILASCECVENTPVECAGMVGVSATPHGTEMSSDSDSQSKILETSTPSTETASSGEFHADQTVKEAVGRSRTPRRIRRDEKGKKFTF